MAQMHNAELFDHKSLSLHSQYKRQLSPVLNMLKKKCNDITFIGCSKTKAQIR